MNEREANADVYNPVATLIVLIDTLFNKAVEAHNAD